MNREEALQLARPPPTQTALKEKRPRLVSLPVGQRASERAAAADIQWKRRPLVEARSTLPLEVVKCRPSRS